MTEKNETAVPAKDAAASWVWDAERQRIVWANEAGITFWGERSLMELVERDFADADEAVHDFADLMHAVLSRKSGRVKARMVLAPSGTPVRVDCLAARMDLPDGRIGLKIDAVRAPMGEDAEVDRLREIIERTPTALSLFAEDGALLMQNAAAEHSFGPELSALAERYVDHAEARNAMRSLLVNGAHSQAVDLKTRVGQRRHRIAMRRMHDPVTGGLAAIVFFTDIADRSGPGPGVTVPLPQPRLPVPAPLPAAAAVPARIEMPAQPLAGPVDAEARLLASLDAGALVFDDALKVRYLSDAARHLLFEPGPGRDGSMATLFPEKRDQIAAALARLRARKAERVDLRLGATNAETTNGQGGNRWLRLEIRAGAWQEQPAWVATLTDITEERRMAFTLRRSVQERDRALESLGLGVATLRRDGTVEAITTVAAALLGSTGAEMTGQPFDRALDEAATGVFRDALAAPGETPRPLTIERPGGGKGPATSLRVALGPVAEDRAGRRTLVVSEGAKAHGDGSKGAARSEAIARASHELRTPLNAIIGFTQIMLDDPDAIRSETYREYLKDIHDSGQYMARLVQDMLDLRRIEAGALSLEPGPVNLGNLIRRIAREIDGAARARDVTLTISVGEDLPTLIADAHTLRQALTNLVGNAVKFTGDAVRISTALHSSGALRIDVTDNGIGMTDDERVRALQPYAQGRHSSRKFGGAGMGLPLAKGFIEANGGHFELVSRENEGTNARIVFPPRLVEAKSAENRKID